MDEIETSVVQAKFAYLVNQGKAEELLDELYSVGAITLDDFQRVCAQVTDSDKMRMLLVLLLKKVPDLEVKTFQALVSALRGANRADLADLLIHCHHRECAKNTGTGLRPGRNLVSPETEPKLLLQSADHRQATSQTRPKFLFMSNVSGEQVTNVGDVSDGGMDVTDEPPTTSTGKTLLNTFTLYCQMRSYL